MRIKVIWIVVLTLFLAGCFLTGCRLKQSSTEDVCIPEGFYDGDSSGYDWDVYASCYVKNGLAEMSDCCVGES